MRTGSRISKFPVSLILARHSLALVFFVQQNANTQKKLDGRRGSNPGPVGTESSALYRCPKRKYSDCMPTPGGQLSKLPARRVWQRRPFFRRGHRGPMCGAGVARSGGRGGSADARDQPVLKSCTKTDIPVAMKVQCDITIITTATRLAYYIMRVTTTTKRNMTRAVTCEYGKIFCCGSAALVHADSTGCLAWKASMPEAMQEAAARSSACFVSGLLSRVFFCHETPCRR